MKRRNENKISFDQLSNADTIWSRLSALKKSNTGKTAQQKLGIEDEGPEPLGGKPMSMMDLVKSMYEDGEDDEQEEDGSSE